MAEKTHFDYAEIITLHVAVFDLLLRNPAPISYRAFSYPNVHAKYSSYILPVSLQCQLSPSLSLCGHPKQHGAFFKAFSGICASFGRLERGASLMFVRPHLNLLNNRQMVAFEKADVPKSFTNHSFP